MHAIRWWLAVSMSAVGFALAWLLADAAGLDTRVAVGVATVAATLVLTPLAWFASRSGQPSPASGHGERALADAATVVLPVVAAADGDPLAVRPQLVVGDVPLEAVAWQRRTPAGPPGKGRGQRPDGGVRGDRPSRHRQDAARGRLCEAPGSQPVGRSWCGWPPIPNSVC